MSTNVLKSVIESDCSNNLVSLVITDCSDNSSTDCSGNSPINYVMDVIQKQKLDNQKKQWIFYCEFLIRRLKKDKNLISLKLKHIRYWWNFVHIYVIIISSILTCFETIKIEFNIPKESIGGHLLSMCTLFFTASVVIFMSITKYLRYSETIQNILIVSNQGIDVIYKLREAVEDTATCETIPALRDEIIKHKKTVITPFNKVREEIDRYLPIYSRVKYNKAYEGELRKEINSRKQLLSKRQKDGIIKHIVFDEKYRYIYGSPYGEEVDTAWDVFLNKKDKKAPGTYALPLIIQDRIYLPPPVIK